MTVPRPLVEYGIVGRGGHQFRSPPARWNTQLSLIDADRNEAEVLERQQGVQPRVGAAIKSGERKRVFSPLPLWPDVFHGQDGLPQQEQSPACVASC